MKHLKGQTAMLWTVGIIIVLAFVAFGLLGGGAGFAGLFSQVASGGGDTGVIATSDTSPTLTFTCVDKFNQGSVVGCGVLKYKINGGSIETEAENNIEVNCNDKVDALINSTGYYTERVTIESVDCEENPSVAVQMLNYDTSPDIQLYNQDDGLINSYSNSEGLPANAIDTQSIKIYPSYQDGIQDAHFFLDTTGTNVDRVTSSLGKDVGKPNSVTHNTTTDWQQGGNVGGTANSDEMYVFSLGTIGDQAIEEFTVTVDIGGTTYGAENATMGIIDKGWFVNHQGDFEYGFQDADNANVEQAHFAFDELVWTASS